MPTVEDLGKRFKEKYPGDFKDVDPAELGRRLKAKYPNDFGDFTETQRQKPLLARHLEGDVARRGRANMLSLQARGGEIAADQEVTDLKAGAAGHVAEALPMMAAAPFTGGASALPAMAIMGGAGLAGGLAEKSIKAATGASFPESSKALAKSLSLDAVLGAAGEGAARSVGYLAKGLIPDLVTRAAGKTREGERVLRDEIVKSSKELWLRARLSGAPPVNIGQAMRELETDLKSIPKPKGPFAAKVANMSDNAAEKLRALTKDLAQTGGGVAAHQDLPELVRLQEAANAMAWDERSLNHYEAKAFSDFADKLRSTLGEKLKAAGGKELTDLFEHTKRLVRVREENRFALKAAESAMTALVKRVGVGTVAGGAVGYREGGVKGAVAGAVAGTVAQEAAPKLAAWLLERGYGNSTAARLIRRGVYRFKDGATGEAVALMTRAAALTGVREAVKPYLEQALAGSSPAAAAP